MQLCYGVTLRRLNLPEFLYLLFVDITDTADDLSLPAIFVLDHLTL